MRYLPRRKSARVACLLVALFTLWAVVQLRLWLHRPMFHNDLAINTDWRVPGSALFRHWVAELPVYDEQNNEIIADHRLNILVVLLASGQGNPAHLNLTYTFEKENGAVFFVEDSLYNRTKIFVPRKQNVLMVFRADGSRDDFPLAPGEAERTITLLREEQWSTSNLVLRNLITSLTEIYSRSHSQEAAARLMALLKKKEEKSKGVGEESKGKNGKRTGTENGRTENGGTENGTGPIRNGKRNGKRDRSD